MSRSTGRDRGVSTTRLEKHPPTKACPGAEAAEQTMSDGKV